MVAFRDPAEFLFSPYCNKGVFKRLSRIWARKKVEKKGKKLNRVRVEVCRKDLNKEIVRKEKRQEETERKIVHVYTHARLYVYRYTCQHMRVCVCAPWRAPCRQASSFSTRPSKTIGTMGPQAFLFIILTWHCTLYITRMNGRDRS